MTAFEFANILIKEMDLQIFSFTTKGGKGKITVPGDTDISSVYGPVVEFNQRGKWMDIRFTV